MARTPTTAQLSKLATLQSAVTTAKATLASAQANVAAAQVTVNNALDAVSKYSAYIYGNAPLPGTIDGGSADAT